MEEQIKDLAASDDEEEEKREKDDDKKIEELNPDGTKKNEYQKIVEK